MNEDMSQNENEEDANKNEEDANDNKKEENDSPKQKQYYKKKLIFDREKKTTRNIWDNSR